MRVFAVIAIALALMLAGNSCCVAHMFDDRSGNHNGPI
jgi:hypothetical protein